MTSTEAEETSDQEITTKFIICLIYKAKLKILYDNIDFFLNCGLIFVDCIHYQKPGFRIFSLT